MSIQTLTKTVQFNCDLSDAKFAADYSICIYLIRMREYYRWAHNLSPNESLDQANLMDWVGEVETRWKQTDGLDLKPLEFEGDTFMPFDMHNINHKLHPQGLTYSAGIGRFNKPIFMLAELESVDIKPDYSLAISNRELARELTAPPATLQQNNILIRKQAVARLIWDMFEEWQWHKPNNAMAKVVQHYGFEENPVQALEQASFEQREVLILHELGELDAQTILTPHWNELLINANKHQQFFARATRDFLADCLSTLPELLIRQQSACIHFYFASLTPMRKAMFPMLLDAYQQWCVNKAFTPLERAIKQGKSHWFNSAEHFIEQLNLGKMPADKKLNHYIEQHIL